MTRMAADKKRTTSISILAAILAAAVLVEKLSADDGRYVAVFVDGNRVSADEILDWGRADAKPSLAGRLLLPAKNRVRSNENTTIARSRPPAAYIEFHAGDRLPG